VFQYDAGDTITPTALPWAQRGPGGVGCWKVVNYGQVCKTVHDAQYDTDGGTVAYPSGGVHTYHISDLSVMNGNYAMGSGARPKAVNGYEVDAQLTWALFTPWPESSTIPEGNNIAGSIVAHIDNNGSGGPGTYYDPGGVAAATFVTSRGSLLYKQVGATKFTTIVKLHSMLYLPAGPLAVDNIELMVLIRTDPVEFATYAFGGSAISLCVTIRAF
jgi:hypothetical protein